MPTSQETPKARSEGSPTKSEWDSGEEKNDCTEVRGIFTPAAVHHKQTNHAALAEQLFYIYMHKLGHMFVTFERESVAAQR